MPGGVHLALRLVPRAGRNGIDGIRADADGRPVLQLRLAAPPVDGAANAALVAFVAEALDLRQREVTIVAGERSRGKRLHLAGEPAELVRRLEAWVSGVG